MNWDTNFWEKEDYLNHLTPRTVGALLSKYQAPPYGAGYEMPGSWSGRETSTRYATTADEAGPSLTNSI